MLCDRCKKKLKRDFEMVLLSEDLVEVSELGFASPAGFPKVYNEVVQVWSCVVCGNKKGVRLTGYALKDWRPTGKRSLRGGIK